MRLLSYMLFVGLLLIHSIYSFEYTFLDKPAETKNTIKHHIKWLTKNTRFPIIFQCPANANSSSDSEEAVWRKLSDSKIIKDVYDLNDGFKAESRNQKATLKIFRYDFQTHDKLDIYEPIESKDQTMPDIDRHRNLFTLSYLKSHAILVNKTERAINITCVADFLVPSANDEELNDAIFAKMEKNALFKLTINRVRSQEKADKLKDQITFEKQRVRLYSYKELVDREMQPPNLDIPFESDYTPSVRLHEPVPFVPVVEDKKREEEEKANYMKERIQNIINMLNKNSEKNHLDLKNLAAAADNSVNSNQPSLPVEQSNRRQNVEASHQNVHNFEQQLKSKLEEIKNKIQIKEIINDYQQQVYKNLNAHNNNRNFHMNQVPVFSPPRPFVPMQTPHVSPFMAPVARPGMFYYKKKRFVRRSDDNDDDAMISSQIADEQTTPFYTQILRDDIKLDQVKKIAEVRLVYGPLTLYRPLKQGEIAVCDLNLLNFDEMSVEYSSKIFATIIKDKPANNQISEEISKSAENISTELPETAANAQTDSPAVTPKNPIDQTDETTKKSNEDGSVFASKTEDLAGLDSKWISELNQLTQTLEDKIVEEREKNKQKNMLKELEIQAQSQQLEQVLRDLKLNSLKNQKLSDLQQETSNAYHEYRKISDDSPLLFPRSGSWRLKSHFVLIFLNFILFKFLF